MMIVFRRRHDSRYQFCIVAERLEIKHLDTILRSRRRLYQVLRFMGDKTNNKLN